MNLTRHPPQWNAGVYYYRSVNLGNGILAKWKASDLSASKITVGSIPRD